MHTQTHTYKPLYSTHCSYRFPVIMIDHKMKARNRRTKMDEKGSTKTKRHYDSGDEVSRKQHDDMPSPDRWELTHTNWYYPWSMPAPNKKKKRREARVGQNKGKSFITSKVVKFQSRVQCTHGEDFPLIVKYKDNSPREIIPDPTKPSCVVCYYYNSGTGRLIFKACKHGSDMCYACASQLVQCPMCRGPRR